MKADLKQDSAEQALDQSLLKRAHELDLSAGEDLSVAVMNLIAIEEHLYFTGMKTENNGYLDTLNAVKAMRVKLMKDLVGNKEGELWCVSKHLLSASMRLSEVGSKYLAMDDKDKAYGTFQDAFSLFSLFWSLKLSAGSVSAGMKEKIADPKSGFGKVSEIMKHILDCCKEL